MIFAGATPNLNTQLNGDKNIRNLVFTGEANYSISATATGGGVLYVRGDATNGATVEVRGGVQTINANLRFGDSSSNVYIINNGTAAGGANSLIFNGAITTNDFDTGVNITNKLLTISGTGNTYISSLERRHATYDMSIVKNGSGTVTINGANANDAGNNVIGTITGTTTINAGKIRINLERALGGALNRLAGEGGTPLAFNAAHLTLNGGTLAAFGTFAIDDAHRGITLGANGGALEVEGSNTLTVANVVTGSGNLETRGPGTVAVTAANTYTGNTTVSSGILLINNLTGSGTGTGNVSVASGATLGGTGSVSGGSVGSITLGIGTQLRVGSTYGAGGAGQDLRLGMGGNVDVSLNGTLQFDLTGAGSFADLGDPSYNTLNINAPANDLLEIETTGALNLNGAKVQISADSALAFVDGYTWKLIDWSNVALESRSYEGMSLATLSLNGFSLTQIFAADGYYIKASVIPEPGRVMLLMVAVFGLMMRRRR